MDSSQRLGEIDQRLTLIEERLSRLESAPVAEVGITPTVAVSPEHDPSESSPLLALSGKSILILGGAFLLRAATESAALPQQIGVLLGLLYATAWIVAATLAARAGRRLAAVFHSAVAAVVAYPIVWEATTHFHVLPAVSAALLLAAFSIALIVVARLHNMQSPAWIAAAGATLVALFLAYATKELIPFALELTVAGIVALSLSMSSAGWLLAIESDLFAIVLIIATLLDQTRDSRSPIVITLLAFSIGWMAMSSRASVQAAVASLIGLAGASALVLEPPARTILWGFAAVVAAEIARRTSMRVFALQSAAWGMLAAIGGGLFSFAAIVILGDDGTAVTPIPALIAAAFCLIAFLRLDFARLPMLAISTCAAATVAIHFANTWFSGGAGMHAIIRTIILSATAVGLAAIGRFLRISEATHLAVITLALTGVQVIAQELRAGTAATMFIALAVYGSAMVAIARLRRVGTIS